MRVELYHDLPGNVGAVDRLEGAHLDGLCVMVDRSTGKPAWSEEDFGRLVAAAHARGLTVRTVHWCRPSWTDRDWARATRLASMGDLTPVLDIEHQARARSTRRRLAERSALWGRHVVSTHAWHPETYDPTHANAPYEIQAYSTSTLLAEVGKEVMPPGWQVKQANRPCGPTRLALAAYGQIGLGAEEPARYMARALRGAMACPNIDTVAYWSLRHVLSPKNRYALPFLRDVVPGIVRGEE